MLGRVLSIALIIVSAGIAEFAQRPTPEPQPDPSGAPSVPIPPRSDPERRVRENTPELDETQTSDRLARLKRFADVIYRRPTRQELAAAAASPELQKQYSGFLTREDSGIIRLVSFDCGKSAEVVSADERCLKLTMPGGAGSFSFRTKNYRIRHLADLTLSEGRLLATGVLMNGIFARLGDVPIETVTAKDFAALTSVKAAANAAEVEAIAKRFEAGEVLGSMQLKGSVVPEVNATYLLRVIAYRGKVKKTIGGVEYNELDFDRRRDVIATFRIVEIDPDGSVTILWRRLSDLESPKIDTDEREEKKRRAELSALWRGRAADTIGSLVRGPE